MSNVEIPDGYEALRFLVGYNDDGDVCGCQADSDWDAIYNRNNPDFEGEPDHIVFFLEKRETEKMKKPVHAFYLKDGKITPAGVKELPFTSEGSSLKDA